MVKLKKLQTHEKIKTALGGSVNAVRSFPMGSNQRNYRKSYG